MPFLQLLFLKYLSLAEKQESKKGVLDLQTMTQHRTAFYYTVGRASQVALEVKNTPANAGDIRDTGSIPRSRRSPGEGHANPLQYSWLENPMDRGAWRATVHSIAQSWTQLNRHSTHAHCGLMNHWQWMNVFFHI